MDMSNVCDRLTSRFGLGSRPDLRRRLYERLEELVNDADDERARTAYQIIAAVASDAVGKRDAGHYFAFVIIRRLQEKGIVCDPIAQPVF